MPTHHDTYPDRSTNRLARLLAQGKNISEFSDIANIQELYFVQPDLQNLMWESLSIMYEILELLTTGQFDKRFIYERTSEINDIADRIQQNINTEKVDVSTIILKMKETFANKHNPQMVEE